MSKATPYTITVSMSTGEFTAKGKTVQEALDNLEMTYLDVKTKGEITIKKGTKTATRFYYCRPLRRIVASKIRKVQVAKDLEYLLA